MTSALVAQQDINLPQPVAFELFTRGMWTWWPREFSWSGPEGLQEIGMECQANGVLYEVGPHGLRWDWGRVLEWRPPEEVVFSWQIGPDRVPVPRDDDATEVRVTFVPASAGRTAVRVEHTGWERHGQRGSDYRHGLEPAWPHALTQLSHAAAWAAGEPSDNRR